MVGELKVGLIATVTTCDWQSFGLLATTMADGKGPNRHWLHLAATLPATYPSPVDIHPFIAIRIYRLVDGGRRQATALTSSESLKLAVWLFLIGTLQSPPPPPSNKSNKSNKQSCMPSSSWQCNCWKGRKCHCSTRRWLVPTLPAFS